MTGTPAARPRHRPGTVTTPPAGAATTAADLMDAALVEAADVTDAVRGFVPEADDHPVTAVFAHRAAAVVMRKRGEIDLALDHARAAVDAAARTRDARLETEGQYTLALCLATAGAGRDAARAADTAVRRADDHALLGARARVHRALVRHRLGVPGALEDYDAALPVLADHGDVFWEVLARVNRANALAYTGELAAARRDLERVLVLGDETGGSDHVAYARHNLGFVATRAGELAAALEAFRQAEEELRRRGVPPTLVAGDVAEALLAAGLVGEAVALVEQHLAIARDEHPDLVPELLLLLGRGQLARGDLPAARTAGAGAATAFADQGRHGWVLPARAVEALAALPLQQFDPAVAVELADRAAATGWFETAGELRAAAALAAARSGGVDRAEAWLADLDRPDELPLPVVIGVAHARMAIARHHGRATDALAHAATAVAALDERRVLLGASELRAHVARLAQHVFEEATLVALQLGDLDQALTWVDRVRSQSLDHPPVVPPDDQALAADLGRLRTLADTITAARTSGDDVSVPEAERARLELRVRDRTRTVGGRRGTRGVGAAPRASGTVEVAWLQLDGRLVALVADDSGTRRVDLAVGTEAVGAELDALGFAMQRVGRSRAPGPRRDLAARSLDHSLATLDTAVVAPLALPADGAVVISPTDVLFDVPWSGLPSLVERAVTVAPSLRLARRPPREDAGVGTVLLEGPRLTHARAELDALADVVLDAHAILGEDATVAAACQTLPSAARAHLACHGVFRADNPQLSSLELADGPMFVYDLEALPRVPPLIVLSACQTGRATVHAGDELLGVTASLLAMGARHVVAAMADVPDDLAAVLMVAFHDAVAAGASPAAALARARGALLALHRDDPAARLTAAAFACVGAP